MITRTWPPGPELRAKLSSTWFRGTVVLLNEFNHSRAPAISALFSRLEKAGGMGSLNAGALAWRLWAVKAHDRLKT